MVLNLFAIIFGVYYIYAILCCIGSIRLYAWPQCLVLQVLRPYIFIKLLQIATVAVFLEGG